MLQWLRKALLPVQGGPGWIPSQGTRFCALQCRPCVFQRRPCVLRLRPGTAKQKKVKIPERGVAVRKKAPKEAAKVAVREKDPKEAATLSFLSWGETRRPPKPSVWSQEDGPAA